jgi:hypothetical protein
MKLPKLLKTMKSGLLLLLLGIPWYFRDQHAVNLEHQSDLVQRALVQAENQEQAEAQNRDQREVLSRLKNVEGAVNKEKDTVEIWTDFAKEVHRDGEDLERQGKELKGLVKDLRNAGLAGDLGDTLTNADAAVTEAEAAGGLQKKWAKAMKGYIDKDPKAAAKTLIAYDVNPSEQSQGEDTQANTENLPPGLPPSADLDAADTAAEAADAHLTAAYTNLKEAAENVRDETAGAAKFWRYVAWVATALAALLAGDWKKFLQTITGGSGDSETADETAEQTA